MNRVLKVYVELDGLFDYRRGLIQKLITQDIVNDSERKRKGDELWATYCETNYNKRNIDNFEYPGLDLKHDQWVKAYKERSIGDFLMFYPTNLPSYLFRKIIEIEAANEKPLDISGLTLFVNVHPYVLDDELKEELIQHLRVRFGGKFVIKLLDHDPSTMTSTYYRQFDYVFKYDILSGPYEWFRRSLETKPIPEVTFFVPDLFAEDVPDIEATPQSLLFACSISVSAIWKMVPIEHNAFDYEKID